MFHSVLGKLPLPPECTHPRKFLPRKFPHGKLPPRKTPSTENSLLGKLYLGKFPPGKLPLGKFCIFHANLSTFEKKLKSQKMRKNFY